jgi:hypothetical protein
MSPSDPAAISQVAVSQSWALGIASTIILALVAVIYHYHAKRQDDQQDRLTDGEVEFANLKKDVASIREWLTVAEQKIKIMETEQAKQHDTLGAIRIHHKNHHQEDLP